MRCAAAGLLLTWWSWSAAAEEPTRALRLQPGTAIERQLAGGDAHLHRIELAAGRSWRLQVEQRGIDVTVGVSAPGGHALATIDSPIERLGPETLVVRVEAAGTYAIEVRSPHRAVSPGRYEIRVDALAEVTARDRERLAAESSMSRAAVFYTRGAPDRRQALEAYRQALPLWRALAEQRGEALTLHRLAFLSRKLGEHRQALPFYRDALTLWRTLGEGGLEAKASNGLGLSLWRLGEYLKARSFFERALALRQALGDRFGTASTRNNLGLMDHFMGDLRPALDSYRQALRTFRELGEAEKTTVALINVGGVYSLLGEPLEALAYYREALALAEGRGDRQAMADALNNLALLSRSLGELQKALTHYDRVLAIQRQLTDLRGEARTLNNIGFVYLSLGDPRRALAFFRWALPIRRQVEDRRGEASTLMNLGNAHLHLRQGEKAAAFVRQALELRRATGSRRGEGVALSLLGQAHAAQGELAKSMEHFDAALQIHRAVGDRRNEAATLYRQGSVLGSLDEPQKARASLDEALRLHRAAGYRVAEARTLHALARLDRESGLLATAKKRLELALEIFESVNAEVSSRDLRTAFRSSQRQAYELYTDLLMGLHAAEPGRGHEQAALAASEKARARTLLELLEEAGAEIGRGIDPTLRERRDAARRRVSAKSNRQLAVLARRNRDENGEEDATEAEREVYRALAELEKVEAEIRRRSPRFAALTQPRSLGAPEIQGLLDRDTVLLEYALGEERSFVWVVSERSVESFELPPRSEVEAAARAVHRQLSVMDPGARQAEREAAAVLSDMLLGPIGHLLDRQRLVVVADGALHYLPFAALPQPRADRDPSTSGNADPLLVRYEVTYLPSASALAAQRQGADELRRAPDGIAIVADPVFEPDDPRLGSTPPRPAPDTELEPILRPIGHQGFARLPATRREAEAIAALAPAGRVRLATGFEASRTLLLDGDLGAYRFLHLATHGLIDAAHPRLSGLVLSLFDPRGQAQDGFLRLHDVYNLDLGAELVVLSGCQTALGEEIRGEGLVGLTRGFMYAGVPRVVASLWRVGDRATAELMTRFYRSMWKEGMRPAAALRAAQLSMLEERRWRDPYYWAAFVQQGDWR